MLEIKNRVALGRVLTERDHGIEVLIRKDYNDADHRMVYVKVNSDYIRCGSVYVSKGYDISDLLEMARPKKEAHLHARAIVKREAEFKKAMTTGARGGHCHTITMTGGSHSHSVWCAKVATLGAVECTCKKDRRD